MTLGLTSAEAAERKIQGLDNRVDLTSSRSIQDIFAANFLSIANIILLVIVVVLVAVGKPGDAFVTGGIVIINVFIGTFQEFRAKRKLDQIALLSRPHVRVIRDGQEIEVGQEDVVQGDVLVLKPGDQAVVDGPVVEDTRGGPTPGYLDMDESLLTGEADLIRKRAGDEIMSGSLCMQGGGVYLAEKVGEAAFAQKITKGARQFTRQYTPLQRQISIIVRGLVVLAIGLSILMALAYAYQEKAFEDGVSDVAVVISLVPQGLLLMITVAYALGALRIAGKGALVQQSNAVESLSHVDVLCLDKTGTLTTNKIIFEDVHPFDGDADKMRGLLGDFVSSVGKNNRTDEAIGAALAGQKYTVVSQIPFNSARKWSGACLEGPNGGTYILGAAEMVGPGLVDAPDYAAQIEALSQKGLRVLLFAHSPQTIRPEEIPTDREPDLPAELTAIGLISLSDELRPNVQDVLAGFRKAGITLKLISGDNPVTVQALAVQAGFDPDAKAVSGVVLAKMNGHEFEQAARDNAIFGRITPEQKKLLVDALRKDGHYVAMMGDGVNDVLSLKQAQVGIAMQDGSQATRSVADIVLLGNKFEALPHAFLEGQRILNGMNDVSRLFLTRTFYAALLIIVAGFINTEFPFTPKHNFLLTTLPVGIPAFFLAAWAKTGVPKKNLIQSVTEFVFPAGFAMVVATVFIWILYRASGDVSVETSRTALTFAALLGGFWIILLAEHEREDWQTGTIKGINPLRYAVTGAMLLLLIIVMAIPGLRKSLGLTTLSWADIGIIAGTMTAWAAGLFVLWRFNVIERVMIPNYSGSTTGYSTRAEKS